MFNFIASFTFQITHGTSDIKHNSSQPNTLPEDVLADSIISAILSLEERFKLYCPWPKAIALQRERKKSRSSSNPKTPTTPKTPCLLPTGSSVSFDVVSLGADCFKSNKEPQPVSTHSSLSKMDTFLIHTDKQNSCC